MVNLLHEVDKGLERGDSLVTSHTSNNAAMRAIAEVYFRPNMAIADVTYGEGVFWKNIDTQKFKFYPSDLKTNGFDFNNLPYENEQFEAVVFDPPYRYTPESNKKNPYIDDRYNLQSSAPKNCAGVIDLYVSGMREAKRVLKNGGFLIVKCQDTIQDGKQHMVHIDIYLKATEMGFACKDMVVTSFDKCVPTRWVVQKSLRKNHSYFWVFRKGGAYPFGMVSSQKRDTE